MQSDTRRRKRYAMSEKRSCEWRVTLTCEKKLIVIACVLEVIKVRRTLVWCYLDVCTAIELIVLCFMVLSSEVLCCLFFVLPLDSHHWIFTTRYTTVTRVEWVGWGLARWRWLWLTFSMTFSKYLRIRHGWAWDLSSVFSFFYTGQIPTNPTQMRLGFK